MGFEINVIPLLKLKDIYFEPRGSKAKKLGEKLNSKPIFFFKNFLCVFNIPKTKIIFNFNYIYHIYSVSFIAKPFQASFARLTPLENRKTVFWCFQGGVEGGANLK